MVIPLISLSTLSIFSGCPSNSENPTETQVYRKNTKENSFRILILGDSLTEGYVKSPLNRYSHLYLKKKLNEEFSPDKNDTYEIINAGISGSTSSGGVARIEWLKSNPDFLIIALGEMMDSAEYLLKRTKNNLKKIILTAKSKNIPILLSGMKMPPQLWNRIHSMNFSNYLSIWLKKRMSFCSSCWKAWAMTLQ